MGRTRSRSRLGWPPNLYPNKAGFKYRHPVTRKEVWMGNDKAKAFAAAKKLNAMLTPSNDLVARVMGTEKTVSDAIKVFREDDVPGRKWAPKTAEVYESVIRRVESTLGERALASLSVNDCATFIRSITPSARSRQQFRLVLTWILACALQEGWIDDNPALSTRKFSHERQRERLTIEAYRAIWEKAPAWVRNAMDLSLLTLLRREDVVSLRFSDVREGALWVVPSKTEETSGVRLKIAVSAELDRLLARCRDDVVSPFLVHRLPGKARPQNLRAKERKHHTQVLPEQLSRAFAAARDGAKVTSENPPTFHEIRSLGGALLQEAGWNVSQVQTLMGHNSEAMTKVYLEGHASPWQSVSTGITLFTQ
ncbi:tyrosine-type recombinase/integrase [Lysobacter sp. LF1]|uniref:Tyrosine-type recombinase/integrase n=1 Tax=Lysobacter stagni TaxID=3045172 RepID=A0ABT6XKU2_9GAMM|nr:tyrosine-type recombinase/integrase [Lysobacter sp. LF1]MDI9240772.1 tyrosine-type recombinase/integrase [Lysobacter sp. LF1]